MIVLLKEASKDENIMDIAKYQLCVNMYNKSLLEKGWIENESEGGTVSPDLSTIFYTSKEPYIGQLVQFRPACKRQYNKILKELQDDFVIIERSI